MSLKESEKHSATTTTVTEEGNPDFLAASKKKADAVLEEEEQKEIGREIDEANKENEENKRKTRNINPIMQPPEKSAKATDPTKVDFYTTHYIITTEQELAKLGPVERYFDLLKRNEDAQDDFQNEDSVHNMQVALAISEMFKNLDPLTFTHEHWKDYYEKKYNEHEKKGKGCYYLNHEEQELNLEAFPRYSTEKTNELGLRKLNAVQSIRKKINEEKKKNGEEICEFTIPKKRTPRDYFSELEDEDDAIEAETIRQGLGGVDTSKDEESRCDPENITYNNHKRLFYLDMAKIPPELKEKTQKEQLEWLKKKFKNIMETKQKKSEQSKELKKIGISFNINMPNSKAKNFQLKYHEKPNIKDFLEAQGVIEDKCHNIDELNTFKPKDPSEMGGHPGAFINIYMPATTKGGDDCQVWGGKKWIKDSRIEYNFYKYINENKDDNKLFKIFKKYIPEFKNEMGKCLPYQPNSTEKAKKEMHYYIPIKNLKNSVRIGKRYR